MSDDLDSNIVAEVQKAVQNVRDSLFQVSSLDAHVFDSRYLVERKCKQYISRQMGLLERRAGGTSPDCPDNIHAKDTVGSLPIGQSLVRKLSHHGILTVEELSMLTDAAVEDFETKLNIQGSQKQKFSQSVKISRQIVLRDLLLRSDGEPDPKRARVQSLADPFTWQEIQQHQDECIKFGEQKISLADQACQAVDDCLKLLEKCSKQGKKPTTTTTTKLPTTLRSSSPEQHPHDQQVVHLQGLPTRPAIPSSSPPSIRIHSPSPPSSDHHQLPFWRQVFDLITGSDTDPTPHQCDLELLCAQLQAMPKDVSVVLESFEVEGIVQKNKAGRYETIPFANTPGEPTNASHSTSRSAKSLVLTRLEAKFNNNHNDDQHQYPYQHSSP
jgi:hypothetical protein